MTVAVAAFEPDVSLWDAWSPEQVADVLSEVEAPWYVAAGWAVDLFLGEQSREHGDIEIAVPQDRFDPVAEALAGLELCVLIGPGRAMRLEDAGDRLADTHQTWVRDATGRWVLDVLREPSDGESWIYRRDQRIRLPYDELIVRTQDGVPYCRPEIALLFKAKEPQPKDQGDFEAVLPRLSRTARRWLADALDTAHPGHPWIHALGDARP